MSFSADSLLTLFSSAPTGACLALATTEVAVAVLGRELVSVLAMRLPTVRGAEAFAAPLVLRGRDGLQVSRVRALPHAAKMVDLVPGWDRPDVQLMCDALRRTRDPTLDLHLPVALTVTSRSPGPARTEIGSVRGHGPLLVDLGQKALLKRRSLHRRQTATERIAVPAQALVVSVTEATRLNGSFAAFHRAGLSRAPLRSSACGGTAVSLHPALVGRAEPPHAGQCRAPFHAASTVPRRRERPASLRVSVSPYAGVVCTAQPPRQRRSLAGLDRAVHPFDSTRKGGHLGF